MIDQQDKPKEEVVITADDCNSALDFWRHFNIPIPTTFQTAVDAFTLDPSFENQTRVKIEICNAIFTGDHEALKDEMFIPIAQECEAVSFEMQFDKDFESTVTLKE